MLSEYLDSRLGGEDRDVIERHLETCRPCSEELESLRMTVSLLNRVHEVRIPRSFVLRGAEKARKGVFEPRVSVLSRPVAVFATAVLEPQSQSWLRLATAIAVIAFVIVLMLDFLQVVPQGGEPVVMGPDQPARTLAALDKGAGEDELKFEGNESLCLGLDEVPSPEVEGNISLDVTEPGEEEFYGLSGTAGYNGQASGGAEAGWPMLQVEIAIGIVAFVMLAVMLYSGWRRRRWKGV